MYQVTIKGRNLAELKKAVSDINEELRGGRVVNGIQKDMAVEETVIAKEEGAPVVETANPAIVPAVNQEPIDNKPTPSADELDVEGIAWDSRIHASTKTKTVKGIWKLKRGIDKDLVAQVKAEQQGQAVTQPVVPAAPVAQPTVTEVPAQPAVVETPVQAAPPVAPPVMNSGHSLETFTQNFPMVMGSLISEGKVTQDYVNQLKGHFGVNEIWMISDEQKASVFNLFVEHKIIEKVG